MMIKLEEVIFNDEEKNDDENDDGPDPSVSRLHVESVSVLLVLVGHVAKVLGFVIERFSFRLKFTY